MRDKSNRWPRSAKITVWVLGISLIASFAYWREMRHRNIKQEQVTAELLSANIELKKENDIINWVFEPELNTSDPTYPTEEYIRQQEDRFRAFGLAGTYRHIWSDKYPAK
ncbi:hypothetical protein [Akkermansia muciniphila]|uniref:hypothetical protein n=1 Tax=Akkermansia muciniphila TaxID=239935 RepID=UPI00138E84CE|nr:hypothetical protein [Akkermansia muciniphila]MCD8247318.1 hypothetical protein [Akkermansia sp.]MCI7760594.1 hypothetical protein [Akkermansia muciniphila]MDY5393322.1 hypothetical protein [Akkermansia muciniphila]QHV14411.1 hypothetical protein C5O09_08680 [Akkermansia muciniphila]QHV16882.1 hypothetical protein C5O10_08725 [Akkermansia muciniphila]